MKATKVGLTLILIGVVMIFVAGPMIVEAVVFRGRPDLKTQYRDFKTEKIDLPADAFAAAPLSEETRSAIIAYFAAYAADKEWIDAASARLKDPEQSTQLRTELEEHAALIDAFARLARRPDYSLDLVIAPDRDYAMQAPNFMLMQTSAKLLAMRSARLAEAGKPTEALDAMETVVLAARAHPLDRIISQLIGVAIVSVAAKNLNEQISAAHDPAFLREAIDRLTQLEPQLAYFSATVPMLVVDNIGMIRVAAANGVIVEPMESPTAMALMAKSAEVQAEYLEQVELKRVKPSSAEAEKTKMQAKGMRHMSALMGGESVGAGGFVAKLAGHFSRAQLFVIAVPNFDEAIIRGDVALSQLSLTRLEAARRLYTLEKGSPPADIAALTPDYLPAIPPDRFARQEESYRLANNKIYSIGPDRKDDSAAVNYDPTNGTTSSGDIFLDVLTDRPQVAVAN